MSLTVIFVLLGALALGYGLFFLGRRRANPEDKGPEAPKTRKQVIIEYVEAFATAIILALFIRAFVVQAFKIPTGSMIPTLLIGDHLLVNKFVYGIELPFKDKKVLVYKNPERNDIIVFKYPEDPKRDFIKRVIAVGGDRIEIKDRVVYVNGKPAEQGFVQFTDQTVIPPGMGRRDNFQPITVPEGKLFVMGDNRDNSHDSRFWGYVDVNEVRGKAFIIYWSWDSDETRPRFGRMGSLVK